MTTIIRKEVRKRGFFGWVFLTLFIVFNLIMLLWLVAGADALSELKPVGAAEEAGHAIGSAVGIGMVLILWAIGSVITGVLALVSRGRKTIVEETVQ
ncbi:hypothetical protein SAMN04515647_4422 [Cohaesibacter sp. ES.047]|uniref:hypothetical protein n=1 Tax=Cohaesibacter sp. ES.047 TaxID=1798205 RepID=UPI000BC03D77|nr:hypothetical protein [Cohaesibacter sp. ES.047]SNY94099.1 hypothetical protein SAMN04515647_4422 [Cohaesibacter sp. ES.047]